MKQEVFRLEDFRSKRTSIAKKLKEEIARKN